MLCRICVAQIRPRKHVLDHAGYTAPAWQHDELVEYASYISGVYEASALKGLNHAVGIGHLSEVCNLCEKEKLLRERYAAAVGRE